MLCGSFKGSRELTVSLKRIGSAWRRGGAKLAAAVALDWVRDYWWERRFGIDTAGLTPIESLVAEWQGFHDYFPSNRKVFHELLAHVDILPGRDVFVDIGSGRGRALLMAAQYPFKRIVGIEISAVLNQAARRNLDSWSGGLVCPEIELWTGDAADFGIPSDATVVYFYNPFHGPTLSAVFEAIARSQARSPRKIWILFNNTQHFRALEGAFPWLAAVARPTFEHACGVYLSAPDDAHSARRDAPNASVGSSAGQWHMKKSN
jgi:SAM-dependent methyltransferase